MSRNVLVLWRYEEAREVEDRKCSRSQGGHMRGVEIGDVLYVCTTKDDELFLLGTIQVRRVRPFRRERKPASGREYEASGRASRPIRIIPLGATKWKLRFVDLRKPNNPPTRLSRKSRLAFQVRAHRFLTPGSAQLLTARLKSDDSHAHSRKEVFSREGRRLETSGSRRERDRRVRDNALQKYGRVCMVCRQDLGKKYKMSKARNCVEIHHLHALADRGDRSRRTRIEDVIVVCPNCHRALHRYKDPAAWRRFQRDCGFKT